MTREEIKYELKKETRETVQKLNKISRFINILPKTEDNKVYHKLPRYLQQIPGVYIDLNNNNNQGT